MSWRDILKKVGEAAAKTTSPPTQPPLREQQYSQPRQPQPHKSRAGHGYSKLVYWIKTHYGNQFVKGMPNDEVEQRLLKIMTELQKTHSLNESSIIGWKAYISQKQYGELVRVS